MDRINASFDTDNYMSSQCTCKGLVQIHFNEDK